MGMAFDLVATPPSSESTYAGIVRLVEAAQRARAPMARLADRYALWFLAATILLAGAAWLATGDPVRALAVLVVATPCPLYPGGAGGDHLRRVAHGQARRARQRREGAGGARPGSHHRDRQDRNAD